MNAIQGGLFYRGIAAVNWLAVSVYVPCAGDGAGEGTVSHQCFYFRTKQTLKFPVPFRW